MFEELITSAKKLAKHTASRLMIASVTHAYVGLRQKELVEATVNYQLFRMNIATYEKLLEFGMQGEVGKAAQEKLKQLSHFDCYRDGIESIH
jgi:hypothetical protein